MPFCGQVATNLDLSANAPGGAAASRAGRADGGRAKGNEDNADTIKAIEYQASGDAFERGFKTALLHVRDPPPHSNPGCRPWTQGLFPTIDDNGTWINGARMTKDLHYSLAPGDQISFPSDQGLHIVDRSSYDLVSAVGDMHNAMSLSAIIDNRILCVHGGIGGTHLQAQLIGTTFAT